MSTKKKVAIIICVIVLLAVGLPFIGFQIYIHTIHFEYDNISNITIHSNDEEYNEAERLAADGYVINCPNFRNTTSFNLENEAEIYSAITSELLTYANEIAKKYKNYAKLDYTVENIDNKKLIIAFHGYGYYYDSDKVDSLDKTYIYDISNVSINNPPVLVQVS